MGRRTCEDWGTVFRQQVVGRLSSPGSWSLQLPFPSLAGVEGGGGRSSHCPPASVGPLGVTVCCLSSHVFYVVALKLRMESCFDLFVKHAC